MKLSVVIPVYNEKDNIEKVLRKVEAVDLNLEKEIIIIDDGSTDGTREILRGLDGKYKIFYQEKNQGKGAAVRKGFSEATGDIVIIQDADLEYDPEDYGKLIEPILKGEADLVYGSRFLNKDAKFYFLNSTANRFLTALVNLLSGLSLSDMETCYKVFSRSALDKIKPRLNADRFGIEPEITITAARLGLRIREVGISYRGRSREDGKKINWRDGIAAVWHIIRFALIK